MLKVNEITKELMTQKNIRRVQLLNGTIVC